MDPLVGALVTRRATLLRRRMIAGRSSVPCHYCGADVPAKDATADHVLPRCRGGKTSLTNLVLACFDCNNRKGAGTSPANGCHLRGGKRTRRKPLLPLRVFKTVADALEAFPDRSMDGERFAPPPEDE